MAFIIYLLVGFASGLLGGMGMGGGTLLIPALTIFLGVEQHIAQATNLVAFLPTAALSLREHSKAGLLRTEGLIPLIVTACLTSVLGGLAAVAIPAKLLKKLFGWFLIALAVKQLAQLFGA